MRNTKKRLAVWACVVAGALLIPLIASQFSSEVMWTGSDYVFAAVLLFGSAFAFEMATRHMTNPNHRTIVGFVVSGVLFAVWVVAATGLEGVIDVLAKC